MKNSVIYIALLLIIYSCTDVLDKQDLTTIDDDLWNDYVEAKAFLTDVYADNAPDMSLGEFSSHSDEFYTSTESTLRLLYGVYGLNDFNDVLNEYNTQNFFRIRSINIAIKKIKGSSLTNEQKEEILGQLYFFRAWRYWDMVKYYGGIPIILEALDPYYDEMEIPRNTTKECVEQICSDLDIAIEYLPANWNLTEDNGRITSVAAAAFKGRVLLSWASPMFSPSGSLDRWTRAYNTNLFAKKLADSAGYGLNPVFENIFLDDPKSNPEAIFYRMYNGTSEFSSGWEGSIRPVSGGGGYSYQPTWNLVKAFPMINGKRISEPSSGYDSIYYWHNRDPRFYATIGYNGCTWEMQGAPSNVVWSYNQAITENRRVPASGFYCKKASNPSIDIDDVDQTSTSWLEIRYTEVLLNLAETANEIGENAFAIELLTEIRSRAGIDESDNYGLGNFTSVEELREKIITERQIELAFENKRYWDLRRLKLFTSDLGNHVKALNTRKRLGLSIVPATEWNQRVFDRTSEYYLWRRIDTAIYLGYVDIEEDGQYEKYFEVTEKELDFSNFDYKDIYYFFPLKASVLRKNDLLEQTIGWQGGTFDPLAE